MAQFTTRVELHGATWQDYEKLHSEMAKHGFARTIHGVDEKGVSHTYQLPTGEYDLTSSLTCEQVRDLAKRVGDSVKPKAWVLVTELGNRCWNLQFAEGSKAA